MGYDTKDPMGSVGSLPGRHSGNTDHGVGNVSSRSNPALSQGSGNPGGGMTDSAPLMGGNLPGSAALPEEGGTVTQSVEGAEPYVYRAKALYACESFL